MNDIAKLGADRAFKSATQELRTETKPNRFHSGNISLDHSFKQNQRMALRFAYLNSSQDKTDEKTVYKVDQLGKWLDFQPALENKLEAQQKEEYTWDLNFSNFKTGKHHFKFGYNGKSESGEFFVSTDKFDYKTNSWSTSAKGNDNFSLTETTQSLYMADEFLHSFLRVNAGLRYELTQLETNVAQDMGEGFGNYGLWLPQLTSTLNIDETQYLTLNFGRRIRRPGFKDLNPYAEEKEANSFKTGNPNLQPEKAWAYEAGYLKNFDRMNVGANIFYRDIKDVIQKNLSEDEHGVVTEQPLNTGEAWLAGIELMTSLKPFDFWQINANYSWFKSEITSGEYQGDALKDQYKWSAKAISDFSLPLNSTLQISVNAVGPKLSGDKQESMIWFSDLGFEKKIMIGGSLIMRVSDLFNSLAKEKTESTDKSSTYELEKSPGRIFVAGVKFQF